MKFRLQHLLLFFTGLATALQGQSVELIADPGFVPYATYYVSGIDLKTGATDVLLFSYLLREKGDKYEDPEVWASLEFEMSMISPSLGIESRTTVIKMETEPFQMFAPLRIDNRQLSTETTFLYDRDSPPNEIPLSVDLVEQMDYGRFESMLGSIASTGKLAQGQYFFRVVVSTGSSKNNLTPTDQATKPIIVSTPTSLNLITPGGALEDTSQNTVYSPYPVFQWETEPCPNCESSLRVARYKADSHSSLDEAIEDVTTLPMDQTQGWHPVGGTTTFQYPFTGAIELVAGGVYVWQVMKQLPTTIGTESYLSPIFSFKVTDLSQPPEWGIETLHPVLQQLRDALGEELFNKYFGPDGVLAGYEVAGTYTMDGMEVSVEAVFDLMNQIRDESVSIRNVSAE
ncbi:MAG: hypothetical protein V3U24_02275 [Candidatus Neomarinimicrobiota bacterium]